MKQKFYVVWVGAKTGVFDNWPDAQAATHGFEGAKYKSFATKAEAESAFKSGVPAWSAPSAKSKSVSPQSVKSSPRVSGALSVDAACSGNPGIMEYQAVWVDTGVQAFAQGPWPEGTNNIGEFLALVHALAWFEKLGKPDTPIYTDSMTALAWVRNRKAKTNLAHNKRTEPLWILIERAEQWLKTHHYSNPILKWDTEHWGEIPADFGRK